MFNLSGSEILVTLATPAALIGVVAIGVRLGQRR
jgi:hypothetical protein